LHDSHFTSGSTHDWVVNTGLKANRSNPVNILEIDLKKKIFNWKPNFENSIFTIKIAEKRKGFWGRSISSSIQQENDSKWDRWPYVKDDFSEESQQIACDLYDLWLAANILDVELFERKFENINRLSIEKDRIIKSKQRIIDEINGLKNKRLPLTYWYTFRFDGTMSVSQQSKDSSSELGSMMILSSFEIPSILLKLIRGYFQDALLLLRMQELKIQSEEKGKMEGIGRQKKEYGHQVSKVLKALETEFIIIPTVNVKAIPELVMHELKDIPWGIVKYPDLFTKALRVMHWYATDDKDIGIFMPGGGEQDSVLLKEVAEIAFGLVCAFMSVQKKECKFALKFLSVDDDMSKLHVDLVDEIGFSRNIFDFFFTCFIDCIEHGSSEEPVEIQILGKNKILSIEIKNMIDPQKKDEHGHGLGTKILEDRIGALGGTVNRKPSDDKTHFLTIANGIPFQEAIHV